MMMMMMMSVRTKKIPGKERKKEKIVVSATVDLVKKWLKSSWKERRASFSSLVPYLDVPVPILWPENQTTQLVLTFCELHSPAGYKRFPLQRVTSSSQVEWNNTQLFYFNSFFMGSVSLPDHAAPPETLFSFIIDRFHDNLDSTLQHTTVPFLLPNFLV